LVEQGAKAWPDLALSKAQFRAFLELRLARGALHAEDLFLVCACVAGVAGAQRTFESRYMPEVARALERRADAGLVSEVEQRLRMSFFFAAPGQPSRLERYTGTGSLRGWVRAVAARTAVSVARLGGNRELLVSCRKLADMPQVAKDPELALIQTRYRPHFDAAFAHALRQLTARERTVLRMHLIDGFNIERIGKAYRVHRATVARWIGQARDSIIAQTQASLAARLDLKPAELRSLLRALRSQLELSLDRFLCSSLNQATLDG
jgi:RNA polymerase sigma-70 factor (ECF subfamily)